MFNLQHQKVVVIGGTSGIGRATAHLARQAGAHVIITGRDAARTLATAHELGADVEAAVLHLHDGPQIDDFFQTLRVADHVFVAAGTTLLSNLRTGSLDEQLGPLNDRLIGSLRIARAAAGVLTPGGSITFTGGISTDRPVAGAWVSGVATAAAEQLARVLALELAPLRCNAISPGYTDTPLWDQIFGPNKDAVLGSVAAKLPVRRIATAEEVAAAVLLLMTNGAMTGEVLHIDGGARLV